MPGSRWGVHDPNYQIALRMVEVVSGMAFNGTYGSTSSVHRECVTAERLTTADDLQQVLAGSWSFWASLSRCLNRERLATPPAVCSAPRMTWPRGYSCRANGAAARMVPRSFHPLRSRRCGHRHRYQAHTHLAGRSAKRLLAHRCCRIAGTCSPRPRSNCYSRTPVGAWRSWPTPAWFTAMPATLLRVFCARLARLATGWAADSPRDTAPKAHE